MKRINIIIIISIVAAHILCFTSCGDNFLHEEKINAYTTQYFETEEGIISLATSLYGNIRWHFGYDWAYGITLYGVDEFTMGADNTSEPWNTYDARFGPSDLTTATGAANANCPPVSGLWDQMYFGIANANLIIANADKITNEDVRNKSLGEAYFLRGYNYYRLFANYGAVPLIDKPLGGVVRNFTRASEEETMALIISDFEQAYNRLPTDRWRGVGTWTKYTAAHFWAKALLYRVSERNDKWNSSYKSADIDKCISLCDEVIAACPLENDFWDIFARWTGIDCELEGSREVLMSAQNNANSASQGRYGNRTAHMFTPQFDGAHTAIKFVIRGTFLGGKDFQRCRPTEYNYATYDNVNDARLWKSFRTVYYINHVSGDLPAGVTAPAPALGDEAIIFILNKKNYTGFVNDPTATFGFWVTTTPISTYVNPETGKWVPAAMPLYVDGQYQTYTTSAVGVNLFAGLNKTRDGSATSADADQTYRDVVMARTGETVLIKAEAQVRKNDFAGAIATVNLLRKRAEWKAGEDRELYVDGSIGFVKNALYTSNGSYTRAPGTYNYQDWFKNSNPGYGVLQDAAGRDYLGKNSYYLSTGIAKTTAASNLQISSYSTLPPEDEAILATLGCSGDYDRMLNFIFNERTRELNGEWNRWEELSRAGLLLKRTKAFNAQAVTNISEKHNFRPIPQTFIDGLTQDNGEPLTDAQKAALQNPGY